LLAIRRCARALAWSVGKPLGLIYQRQLFLFLFGQLVELIGLGLDLPSVGFTRRADRQPFSQRHREGAGQEARKTGHQDRVRRQVRAGHSHDEAQIGAQPVVCAEHGRAQRVAAKGAMSALQSRDRRAAERARRLCRQRLDDAGVRALGRGQPAGNSFRLPVIGAAVQLLERVDAGQDEGRTKTARQPSERPHPKARPQARHALADRPDLAFPELGMRLLDRAEASINLRQLWVLLGLRQRSVERGAVNLPLQIGLVALARIFLGHFRFPVGRS
jgi:hypothetical protein